MRKFISLAVALLAFSGPAFAVNKKTSLNDIRGKWCSHESNYTIGRDYMIVDSFDGKPAQFKVFAWEFDIDRVRMYWMLSNGTKTYTEFTFFVDDTMTQVGNQEDNDGQEGWHVFRKC